MKKKALSLIDMIMRDFFCFSDPFTFKCLDTAINRPQLEYDLIIWETYNTGPYVTKLKKYKIIFFDLFVLKY